LSELIPDLAGRDWGRSRELGRTAFSADPPGLPVKAFVRINTEDDGGQQRPRRSGVLEYRALTERIIGLAIEVHRTIGPGLLESVYAECLCLELEGAAIPFQRQVMIVYKGTSISLGFRTDILVADKVILEIKAVSAFMPAHEAQILTYLRMSGIRVGLLLNFHAPRLKDGLLRFVV
jgi:GxxExxY protein